MAIIISGVVYFIRPPTELFTVGSDSIQTTPSSKSVRKLGNEIKDTLHRQEKYARRLPPNTLTYANWEMLSSIANFLKEWRPVPVNKKA